MGSFIKDVTQKLCFLDRPYLSCHAKNDVTQSYSYITVTQVSKDPPFLLRDILYERPLKDFHRSHQVFCFAGWYWCWYLKLEPSLIGPPIPNSRTWGFS